MRKPMGWLAIPVLVGTIGGFAACSNDPVATCTEGVDCANDAGTDTAKADSGPAKTYAVGGAIAGYAGTGLALENGAETLQIAKGATTFAFANKLAAGAKYAVTIKTQPTDPSQTCTLAGDTGSIAAADVTTVKVTCVTNTYPVSATVTGLKNAGLVLQNNAGDDLPVSAAGAGPNPIATFATKVASGAKYAVTIKTQPTDQTCTVSGATGTVVAGPITTVAVTCTNLRYTVGGAVTGLAGAGLVVQNNLGDDATVNANGTYSFATPLETAQAYSVTIKTQPTNPWQTCTIANPSGTIAGAKVTNADITCVTNTYMVGANVAGLKGSGLVLQNNAGDNLAIAGNGLSNFATKVASGAPYKVTVLTQPTSPSQTCSVTNGASNVAGADVANINVTCVTNMYSVGGTLSGLNGGSVTLQNNAGDNLVLNANAAFKFNATLDSGNPYGVTVLTQPAGQFCTITNGSGTVGAANVTNVGVNCIVDPYISTGAEGAFNPVANTVLPPGVHNFTTINIPNGVTVTTSGSGVLDLRATGAVTIAGTISVVGGGGGAGIGSGCYFGGGAGGTTGSPTAGAAGNNSCKAASVGGSGGVGGGGAGRSCTASGGNFGGGAGGGVCDPGGGGGGYAGGAGAGAWALVGAPGASFGGAAGGAAAAFSTPSTAATPGGTAPGLYAGSAAAGGTCGGQSAPGGGGGSIGAPAAADLAVTSATFYAGSGGGGGGGQCTNCAQAGGGGGGGGGGVIRVASPVSISISGTLRADGGGGAGTTDTSGAGGGGSGGVIFLATPNLTTSGTLSAVGGAAGTTAGCASGTGGAGGLGRIRISVGASCNLGGAFAPALAAACAPTNTAARPYIATYPN